MHVARIEMSDLRWVVDLVGRHSMMKALLVPAFVDLDAVPRQVTLFPDSVFIESGSGYLSLKVDAGSGQLQLSEVRVLEIPPALRDEPSVDPVFADLSPNYLDDVHPLQCSGVLLCLDADSSGLENQFRAIGFRVGDRRILFFDPFWPSGIRIGGESEVTRIGDEIPEGGIVEIEL